ncbi:thiopurine S-methyltransferase [Colwellia psychrerythraea]|uniref:Thiopurine S-methyltransferase n=1 Tax=Colwellia psychrerythraea (strain 34H / ATCC BAA-681) TaxID=167879 RepID=Q47ZH6_COLP3|nr:thiopurine S-methyltransferase [Colwellia psychrerythraea]AAZ26601.1 thiopurine S-methyltransferase family protein [Colwellia psychrerythraea 34H]
MDSNFWHQLWESNEIGFHQRAVNPLLAEYINTLSLAEGDRLFLPLCGKTLDIAWLLSKGYRVAGAELNKPAVEQLFSELGVEPRISTLGNLDCYSAENIDIFVGDIFELSSEILGGVDAIYDRAALVALPDQMRKKYRAHLLEITRIAPQLLLTFEYDQTVMEGPPFSISPDDIKQYYSDKYSLSLLKKIDVPGGLKGKCEASETIWLLSAI